MRRARVEVFSSLRLMGGPSSRHARLPPRPHAANAGRLWATSHLGLHRRARGGSGLARWGGERRVRRVGRAIMPGGGRGATHTAAVAADPPRRKQPGSRGLFNTPRERCVGGRMRVREEQQHFKNVLGGTRGRRGACHAAPSAAPRRQRPACPAPSLSRAMSTLSAQRMRAHVRRAKGGGREERVPRARGASFRTVALALPLTRRPRGPSAPLGAQAAPPRLGRARVWTAASRRAARRGGGWRAEGRAWSARGGRGRPTASTPSARCARGWLSPCAACFGRSACLCMGGALLQSGARACAFAREHSGELKEAAVAD